LSSRYTFRSKKLEINFFSIDEAEQIEPKETMALISMSDEGLEPKINYQKWGCSLTLHFDDIKSQEDGLVFSSKMAKSIIDFALTLPPQISYLAIHCFAGISRSGAVTKFLTEFVFPECYNEQFDTEYSSYNKHVYQTLCRAWQKERP
jgi:predicted protein tyrosine phosphatase